KSNNDVHARHEEFPASRSWPGARKSSYNSTTTTASFAPHFSLRAVPAATSNNPTLPLRASPSKSIRSLPPHLALRIERDYPPAAALIPQRDVAFSWVLS